MPQTVRFHDRIDAGRRLAIEVGRRFGIPSAVVAVSAGGGVVALSLARAFARPLAFAYCAPLLLPWDGDAGTEFGAIAPDGQVVLDYASLAANRLSHADIEQARRRATGDVRRFYGRERFASLADVLPAPRLLMVDEGLCPGWRMEAALGMVRRSGRVSRILVAAPCASPAAASWFAAEADGFAALHVDADPVAEHFDAFEAVSIDFLQARVPRARRRSLAAAALS
jgi:putative phosphoribosyl transferase